MTDQRHWAYSSWFDWLSAYMAKRPDVSLLALIKQQLMIEALERKVVIAAGNRQRVITRPHPLNKSI